MTRRPAGAICARANAATSSIHSAPAEVAAKSKSLLCGLGQRVPHADASSPDPSDVDTTNRSHAENDRKQPLGESMPDTRIVGVSRGAGIAKPLDGRETTAKCDRAGENWRRQDTVFRRDRTGCVRFRQATPA